jgi:hypothetical protein
MKNQIIICIGIFYVFLMFFFTISGNAQIIKGEVMAGLNMTQVDGDEAG